MVMGDFNASVSDKLHGVVGPTNVRMCRITDLPLLIRIPAGHFKFRAIMTSEY